MIDYRQKCRSSTHKGSRKGTGLSTAVRSTTVTIPARKEGSLLVPEAAAVGSHRESGPLSPHPVATDPRDPALRHFRIRHPDLQPSNIIVSRSSDSNLHVVGLIDWQHTSILPVFLLAGIPQRLQNYDDAGSRSMKRPSLPEKLDNLDETQQSREMELYRRRLVHYHYVKNTEKYNERHYAALTDPMGMLRRRLFRHAGDPWEGKTLALKVALIQATKNWETLTGEGGGGGGSRRVLSRSTPMTYAKR